MSMVSGVRVRDVSDTCVVVAVVGWKTNLMTITNDTYPMNCIGTVSGLLMLGSGIGGFLFQDIVARMAASILRVGLGNVGIYVPLALLICVVVLRRTGSHGSVPKGLGSED